jgi:bifunctional UDP-N-acetylglucosamine pyrophosphorylase/glucosamine-1-phosphate N-acetyltransferase
MAARSPRTLAAVVLAAGKGERLKSSTPKVLHPVCGKPALWHTLRLAASTKPDRIVVVVGVGAAEVTAAVRSWDVRPAPTFVTQRGQLGTGHAVLAAKRAVGTVDDVLILTGDFDPIEPADLRRLVGAHRRWGAVATVASTVLDEPGGYGRVVREGGRLVEVVEDVDASPAVKAITEVSLISMVVRRRDLFRALPRLDRRNRQREYYLNRILPLFIAEGLPIRVVEVDTGGAMGLNSRRGLAAVEAVVRRRVNDRHLANGVSMIDPAATYIDVGVRIGRETLLYPNTYLQGDTVIGADCTIGPSCVVADSRVGDGSAVWFAVVIGSRIGRDVEVGPFVRMRPGVEMGDGSRAGAFVDMKEARVGRGSKVPHLSYVGDAEIGRDVNIGAATVTVNFDGRDKHRTVIGDGARIGSDTMLVAPVTIGPGAVTGAGSVITKDVPAGALAVERAETTIVEGYRARRDARRRTKGS